MDDYRRRMDDRTNYEQIQWMNEWSKTMVLWNLKAILIELFYERNAPCISTGIVREPYVSILIATRVPVRLVNYR